MKNIILTPDAPAPIGPYSQAVSTRCGSMVFCSGQIALDPHTKELCRGDVVEQTERVMQNLKAVLTAANVSFENVVKTTIFLVNMDDFPKVNQVYQKYFSQNPPARSTIAVQGLPLGVRVEIEAIAVVP